MGDTGTRLEFFDVPKTQVGESLAAYRRAREAAGARVIWAGQIEQVFVGADVQLGHLACLCEYPKSAATSSENLIPGTAVKTIEARPVLQRMLPLIHLVGRGMRLMRPIIAAGAPDFTGLPATGGINPKVAQGEKFLAANQNAPVTMINLLRFRKQAAYAEGGDSVPGEVAYRRYGKVAIAKVLRLGGFPVWIGKPPKINGAREWDEIVLVHYPSRMAFRRMLTTPAYLAALQHRDAGLEATNLLVCTPLI